MGISKLFESALQQTTRMQNDCTARLTNEESVCMNHLIDPIYEEPVLEDWKRHHGIYIPEHLCSVGSSVTSKYKDSFLLFYTVQSCIPAVWMGCHGVARHGSEINFFSYSKSSYLSLLITITTVGVLLTWRMLFN